MTTAGRLPALLAPAAVGVIRVGLGILWLHEGFVKYRAHFGAADILLVASGAQSNSRVPGFFREFADFALAGAPHLFGILMPLLETLLGLALIAGVLTLPVALGSVFTLMTYWSSDQLITQYPVMVFLAVIVIAFPILAARFSLTTAMDALVTRRRPGTKLFPEPVRRWL